MDLTNCVTSVLTWHVFAVFLFVCLFVAPFIHSFDPDLISKRKIHVYFC